MKALVIILFILSSYGSYSKQVTNSKTTKTSQKKRISPAHIIQVLDLPLMNRLDVLRKKPKIYFKELIKVFQTKNIDANYRWKALMAMARLNPNQARPYIVNSLKHPSWYYKNAGLIAMEIADPRAAVLHAVTLLDDPSLVLRTAAVEVIRRQKAVGYKKILKQKLYDEKNFRNGSSLWIRPYIARTLVEFSDESDKKFFLSLLTDKDAQLHPIALQALERINALPPQNRRPMVASEKQDSSVY